MNKVIVYVGGGLAAFDTVSALLALLVGQVGVAALFGSFAVLVGSLAWKEYKGL